MAIKASKRCTGKPVSTNNKVWVDDSTAGHRPSLRIPMVTLGLISASISVFLIEQSLSPDSTEKHFSRGGVWHHYVFWHPSLEPNYLALLSSMFAHKGVVHILSNM